METIFIRDLLAKICEIIAGRRGSLAAHS
jgi:hypothetical protein